MLIPWLFQSSKSFEQLKTEQRAIVVNKMTPKRKIPALFMPPSRTNSYFEKTGV